MLTFYGTFVSPSPSRVRPWNDIVLRKVHKCYLILPKWILDEVQQLYIGFRYTLFIIIK
jgi:hypothetical protein